MTTPAYTYTLRKYSGEFEERPLEDIFLKTTWVDYRSTPALTLLILGIMTIVFSVLAVYERGMSSILFMRVFVALCLALSGYYINRAQKYFDKYPYLLLINQLLIPITIFVLTYTGEINLSYLVISTIGLTLIYYQFFSNKFSLSVTASWLFGHD